MAKSRDIADMMRRKNIGIACIQGGRVQKQEKFEMGTICTPMEKISGNGILTTNLAAVVWMCVSVQNLTNFCPHALISNPNVPKILFA